MSYNGTGTFNINTAGQPVVTGTTITSTAFNLLTADLASGLTTALTKDGQTTPTANIPMGTYKITGLGAGTSATDAAQYGQLQIGATTIATVTGTDTLTGTLTPALTAYATGNLFSFVAANTNTGATTININSLGVKSITKSGTTALAAGDMVSGRVYLIEYDGTRFQLINPTPAAGGSPGGSTTQLQYNNAGAFGGISGVTTDGTRMTASTTIGVGGATPSTSGSGITFPATQSASSNANTLDDYEEGTWTPAVTSNSGTSTTYTIPTATYTKTGRMVVVLGSITPTNGTLGAAGSFMKVSGLPFTAGVTGAGSGGNYYNLNNGVSTTFAAVSTTRMDVVFVTGCSEDHEYAFVITYFI